MTTLDYISVRKTFPNTVALEGFDLNVKEGELISKTGLPGTTFCPNLTNDLVIRPANGEAISA